jgi:hypothetical protein
VVDPFTGGYSLPAADEGKWAFPVGTVMVKNFMFPDTSRPTKYKVVETRLLVHFDHLVEIEGKMTEWVGYGYQWNDAQTDATIIGVRGVDGSDIGVTATFNVTGGATPTVTWNYPSRLDCITCHMPITPPTMPSGGFTIGPETMQMNRVAAADMATMTNQIDKFAAMNMFDATLTKPYKTALVPPYNGQSGMPPASASLDDRARSYLHANCSFCHRPDGIWNGFDIRWDIPLKDTGLCGYMPDKGDLGVPGSLLIKPGAPESSVVYLRMHAPPATPNQATGRMPQIGSQVPDPDGTKLISDWIKQMPSCPM